MKKALLLGLLGGKTRCYLDYCCRWHWNYYLDYSRTKPASVALRAVTDNFLSAFRHHPFVAVEVEFYDHP